MSVWKENPEGAGRSSGRWRWTWGALVLAAVAGSARAQQSQEPAAAPGAAGGPVEEFFQDSLSWRCIGPARGGRVTAVCGVPGEPRVYYMGATGGGVWKTINGGITWESLSDRSFATGSVGAVAVAPSDPNVVYAGMGEACVRGNFSRGDGVYRSLDAGATWSHVGLADSQQIGAIVVDPRDPDTVFVAALGHVYGESQERGVYRSRDGGGTWERVQFVDAGTGAVDLALDPRNPRVVFAAFWQVRRTPWSLESGGPGSGLFRSRDGGDTWEPLTHGLPPAPRGRIGVAVSPVDSHRVWAIVEAEEGGVFRSDDGGDSFTRVNEDRSLRQRAWYYSHVTADPEQVDTVYVLNVRVQRSTDGGKTFQALHVPHGDMHALWIAPEDSRRMISGSDGGAAVSFDGGNSWSSLDNQPTAQFYHVATDQQFPFHVYGAQQDNSTVVLSIRSTADNATDFHDVGGGESGYVVPDPRDPDVVYAGSYGGYLTRYDHGARSLRDVTVWPQNPMGWGAAELRYRFQWTFPILLSPHDPDTLYVGANVLFRSQDGGTSWAPISPDLTTNDKSKQGPSGGPITFDNTSVEYYCTIFTIAESPLQAGLLWVGTDDGRVQRSADGGASWEDVTPRDLSPGALISMVEASSRHANSAYLAVDGSRADDLVPRALRSHDGGATWQLAAGGIPSGSTVRAVREDPVRGGMLYAATETGVFVSFDDGDSWEPLQFHLPHVPVTDLVVKDRNLVISTQGRSFWVFEDLDALRSFEAGHTENQLLAPPPVTRTRGSKLKVRYHLAEETTDPVRIDFLDAGGNLVRSFDSSRKEPEEEDSGEEEGPAARSSPPPATKQGTHLFEWDLRHAESVRIPAEILWSASNRGPLAIPGTYEVQLRVGDTLLEQSFEILPDPRLQTTREELEAQLALLLEVRDAISAAHRAVNEIRALRTQLQEALDRARRSGNVARVEEAGQTLGEKLDSLEQALMQPRSKSEQDPLNYPIGLDNQIACLAGVVEGGHAPTRQARLVFDELSLQLSAELERWSHVRATDVPDFNARMREAEIPALVLSGAEQD